jgi:hypothetical protein
VSGGLVELEVEAAPVELVLVPLVLVLLLVLGLLLLLGASLRTCLVIAIPAFRSAGRGRVGRGRGRGCLGCGDSDPSHQHRGGDQSNSGYTHASVILTVADESRRPLAVTYGNRSRGGPVPRQSRDKKGATLAARSSMNRVGDDGSDQTKRRYAGRATPGCQDPVPGEASGTLETRRARSRAAGRSPAALCVLHETGPLRRPYTRGGRGGRLP